MNHYEVLGVAADADAATLHRAYLRLARQHHPDRPGGDAERMRTLNEAWTILGDARARARYDLEVLRLGPSGPAAGPSPADGPGPGAGPRRGYEPDPRYDRTDDLDPASFIDPEDRPFGRPIVLPPLLRMLPAGTFAGALATLLAGTIFASGPVLALGLMLMALAGLFFLAAPLMALLVAHRTERRSSDL